MDPNSIRYVHTNLIAADWRRLADFYVQAFGCTPVPPERDLEGHWLERLTGMDGVHLRGVHLRLPGAADGPTLEIFSYEPEDRQKTTKTLNRKGFGHIAFATDDVAGLLKRVLECGGSQVGDLVVQAYNGFGVLTCVYAADPEGNIIELQHWDRVDEVLDKPEVAMEMNDADPIGAYIAECAPEVRPMLEQLREVIREAAPMAVEKLSWRMPTFWWKENLIHFAAFKKHIGLYPGADGIETFADRFREAGYVFSKGAVQLPLGKPMPLELVREITAYRVATVAASGKKGQ